MTRKDPITARMLFALGLRLLREESGMSQRQLAIKLGIPQTSVSRWERGTALPNAFELAQLGVALEEEETP